MSFFNSSSDVSMHSEWSVLDSEETLDGILNDKSDKPIILFKHSTRCGISNSVKKQLEKDWHYKVDECKFYYLDLLLHRDLSNKISESIVIQHESPQVILLRNGKVLHHASHSNIDIDRIDKAMVSR